VPLQIVDFLGLANTARLFGRQDLHKMQAALARIAFSFFVDADALPGETVHSIPACCGGCKAKPVFDAIRSHLRKR
jgi:hypothetical protein